MDQKGIVFELFLHHIRLSPTLLLMKMKGQNGALPTQFSFSRVRECKEWQHPWGTATQQKKA